MARAWFGSHVRPGRLSQAASLSLLGKDRNVGSNLKVLTSFETVLSSVGEIHLGQSLLAIRNWRVKQRCFVQVDPAPGEQAGYRQRENDIECNGVPERPREPLVMTERRSCQSRIQELIVADGLVAARSCLPGKKRHLHDVSRGELSVR